MVSIKALHEALCPEGYVTEGGLVEWPLLTSQVSKNFSAQVAAADVRIRSSRWFTTKLCK